MRQPNAAFAPGLRGVRILDFTWAGAGPFCTEMLCLMGAEVLKVESSDRPDLLRISGLAYGWGVTSLESNPGFNDMNAGKLSIEIDLKHPQGAAVARRLALAADVVCDNMRPGKMEALGLGYEALNAVRPDVICCSVSATGRVEGEKPPEVSGYGPVFWAEGGAASVTGFAGSEPTYMRAPADMNAATFTAIGVLAALIHRQRTGQGCYVDCSAIETVGAVIGDELLATAIGAPAGGLRGNDRAPWSPNDVLPCAGEDWWLAVSVDSEAQWVALCEVLGARDLLADPDLRSRWHRWSRREEVRARLAVHSRESDVHQLARELQMRRVPAAVSQKLKSLLADEELNRRAFWQTTDHPVLGAQKIGTLPWSMQPPLPPARPGPLLGEHTRGALARWLDLSEGEVNQLVESGAVRQQDPPTAPAPDPAAAEEATT